jgi:uncharacterized protein YceH (UPF0502 family)
MEHVLTANERRVLGALIEKALSQPDYYPMTLNAIQAACNQRSNRHPVMSLDDTSVQHTLDDLRRRGLVAMVLAAPGARSTRYRHDVETKLGWNRRQQAIMAELLLRGPQTPGELRTRAARMFQFETLEAVTIALDSLARPEEGPPFVAQLPRESGQSATRYTHLMYPEGETPAAAPSAIAAEHRTASPGETSEIRQELDTLRAEVADLRQRVESVERQLGV